MNLNVVSAALSSIETAPRMLTAAELAALCVDFNSFCNKVKKWFGSVG